MPVQKYLETYWRHHVYTYKKELALDNQQVLIRHKIQPTHITNHVWRNIYECGNKWLILNEIVSVR